ncbi:MAG TPA: glycosyltransferase family 4 protein, partial [Planctomycetaceae bacterium]|nr:glycosyltransferase family 4 protein [Planctomycetaceae bacterium]
PFTVGYFARICPEKGLHHLIEAFRRLCNTHPEARLRVGGYLGKRDIAYFRDLERGAADLSGAWEYVGSPDRVGKVEFLKSLDVLSVPTDYREPKGIYVLEALANGVPVVQPAHGAFPELLAATEGGLLVAPGDPQDLADRLAELHQNPERRIELGRRGQARVRELFGPTVLAERTLAVLERPRMLNVQQPAVEVT